MAPSARRASPWKLVSTPAMMRMRVDLPAPFIPSTPILAPGRKDRVMSLSTSRLLGPTTLVRRYMV
ncbi:hypothetical protein D3C87_1894260 [compost metagenome]